MNSERRGLDSWMGESLHRCPNIGIFGEEIRLGVHTPTDTRIKYTQCTPSYNNLM